MAAGRRSFFSLSRAEARGHAIILAVVLWAGAGALMFSTPGYTDPLGSLKGTDFVHFYTLGRTALLGEPDRLYDRRGLHEFQTVLVPESSSSLFVPVYPPQTALMFAPVATLPYGWALAAWSAITAAAYALTLVAARRRWAPALDDRVLVVAAALGFSPFWNLILHGQTTIAPLLGFLGGWLALERGRPFLAGVALGLIAIKPQFGLVLAVVVLAAGEWAMLAGALLSAAVQAAVVAGVLGPDVIAHYGQALFAAAGAAEQLEPRPYQLHSVRAVTRLLPAPLDSATWAALSAVVVWQALRMWRSAAPVAARFSVLVLASVLVSPHVTVYDATLLAMPLLLLGGWIETENDAARARRYWPTVYGLFVAFIVPFALIFKLQISVLLQAWLLRVVTKPSAITARQVS